MMRRVFVDMLLAEAKDPFSFNELGPDRLSGATLQYFSCRSFTFFSTFGQYQHRFLSLLMVSHIKYIQIKAHFMDVCV
jgi:hypothetical protein